MISSCPLNLQAQLRQPLDILNKALSELGQQPTSVLAPRPVLILTGFMASSTYLLEHAIWASASGEPTREVDVEVFQRWAVEGGMLAAIDDVRRAKQDAEVRAANDLRMVFGESLRAKL